ncbi:MAG TPA: hypothetical protein VMI30_10240 [Stellaceae bacterium]|nr:hypothetical protein [Stellaceae bacterium]
MRTTIDLPDALFRRAKAEAALRGYHLKDLIADALRTALNNPGAPGGKPPETLHDAMSGSCGVITDAPSDYATNPDYLAEFGR